MSEPVPTDRLIEALSDGLEPGSPRAPWRWLALWTTGGLLLSAILMMLWLGPRRDMSAAISGPMFWVKLLYTLTLGALSLWLAERLGRPGTQPRRAWISLAAVGGLFAIGAAFRFAMASPVERRPLLMGHSAVVCPCYILILSIPLMTGVLVGLRRFAPTSPGFAGAAAGLAAGGLAAFVYAFSCNESGMPFVAVWYTLPVLVCGAVGAMIGRTALRW